jgi:hypothetical protein
MDLSWLDNIVSRGRCHKGQWDDKKGSLPGSAHCPVTPKTRRGFAGVGRSAGRPSATALPPPSDEQKPQKGQNPPSPGDTRTTHPLAVKFS